MQQNKDINLTHQFWTTIFNLELQSDTEGMILNKISQSGKHNWRQMEQKIFQIVTTSKMEEEILQKISEL